MRSIAEPVRFAYPSRDGRIIVAYRWQPMAAPPGIVQLTHGMGEHLRRDGDPATAVAAEGHERRKYPDVPLILPGHSMDSTAQYLGAERG